MTVTIENTYTGNGSTTDYSFTFPYLDTSDIKVTLATVATTAYSLLNATTVRFDSAPGNGVAIRIYRETAFDTPKATFYPGSAIRANDLNDNTLQNLYVNQESNDKVADAWLRGDQTVISSESWYTTDDTKVASTKAIEGRIDTKIDTALTGDIAAGNKITVTDNSPSSGQITVALTSGSLVNSDVNTSAAIAGTKISPDFGSQNVSTSGTLASGAATVTGNIAVSGTVDGRDVAADGTKLDGIESAATADQTAAEIRTLVESASDSNVFTDADHSKLNAIEAGATADQTNAEIRAAVEAASDSNVFTDADHSKLNAIEASATADQTASEIKSLIASSPLDDSHLAANSVTTDKISDAELTTLAGMQSGTASILASSTALTSTTTELNQLDGKTLGETTLTTNSDTAIPTSKAVNDRILTVTNALGGFVAIADKDNFPTSNPDPSGNAGTVVSISNAAGISVNSSGVGSLATRAGGSDAVIINGFPSALRGGATVGSATNANPYILPSNVGLQVQTTSTDHTYDYHKYLINEEDANKLSGDIQDFQERYRVASSAPSSSLDDGDLWFDTTNDKMKVYNATSSSWDDVATVGDFFINTLSSSSNTGGGSATFNGTAYRFVLSSPPTSAQQLIVSVNGVIQKPNAGSSQPSEGFAVSGNDIIFSAAPPSGADYFITTQGSAVSIGTPSDNTISTAKLQNLAVTGDKIATNLDLADNKKIRFGTGNDLSLYHNGSHSYIVNGTGNLYITAKSDEDGIIVRADGASELYYDNSKKFETTSSGANVYGHLLPDTSQTHDLGSSTKRWSELHLQDYLYMPDDGKIRLGASYDFQFYHNGSHSIILGKTGHTYVSAPAGSAVRLTKSSADNAAAEHMLVANADGAVELYYDNGKRFETTSNGVIIQGPGAGVIKLYADSGDDDADKWLMRAETDSVFQIMNYASGSWENSLEINSNGNVELYYDNSRKLETISTGVKVTGNLELNAPTQGIIWPENGGRAWDLRADQGAYGQFGLKYGGSAGDSPNETAIEANANGNVELYYDNSKKFETWSGGAQCHGSFHTDELVLQDNEKIKVGTGADLQIYHDGNNSYIDDTGTGSLILKSSRVSFNDASDTSEWGRFDTDGLKFNGDTAAANALDDYEEGTWTPTLNKAGATGVVDSGWLHNIGRYVRVGKMLWISFYIQKNNSSFGTGTEQWYIGGLPFGVESTSTGAYQFIPIGYYGINGSEVSQTGEAPRLQANSTNGTSTITMYGSNSKTNWTTSHFWLSATGFLEVD